MCVFQKVHLTLGPKKCEFQGGLVPPRFWAGDEPGEKVKMKSSSQVLQDHVRLLLSRGPLPGIVGLLSCCLINTNRFQKFGSGGFLSISCHTARRFPTSPFSTYHRRTFKFLVKQPQLKCCSFFISKGEYLEYSGRELLRKL